MKAIIQNDYSGIEGLSIQNMVQDEKTPLSAIIENKYIPVLPYDWMTEEGQLHNIRPVRLPLVIGYGFAGVVKEVGFLRDKSLIGQKVIGAVPSGSAKEIINNQIPPMLFKVHENVSLMDAATLIGGADAALLAVRKLQIAQDDVVLITGASGGVGTYLIQLIKLMGAQVISLGSRQNQDFLKEVGTDYFISYEDDLNEEIKKVPTINKIIDTVGIPDLLNPFLNNFEHLEIASLSMTSLSNLTHNQKFTFINGNIGINGYKELLQMLSERKIQAYIQKVYDFRDVIKAQQDSKYNHSKGRILLSF